MSDENEREDLPRSAAKSGPPQGGHSTSAGKAPPGTSEREDIPEHVSGGPTGERAGPGGAEGDTYRSQKGAASAMSGAEDAEPQDPAVDESAAAEEPVHVEGVGKGEGKMGEEGRERGSEDRGQSGAGRPAGKRGDSSGVVDDEPTDPESPPDTPQ
jgi:hypothetical protein